MPTAPRSHPLHVVHFIVGLQAGGAEVALSRLIRKSSGRELRHTVVSLTGRGDLATAIEDAGGTVVSLDLKPNLTLPSRLIGAFSRLRGLSPDILQGWMVHGNLAAWAVRLLLYPRAGLAWNLRMSLRNAIHESPRTLALTRFAGRASRSVDLLISNSVSGLEDHQVLGYAPRQAVVIPNGFDPEVFRPDADDRERTRREWALPRDAVVFGLIGRYHPAKGHDVFIQAAAKLRDRADMVFVLVGRNAAPDNPGLAAALDSSGVADRFRLLGPRDDISAVLCGLDVVCMPSFYEGFPNALGEAMMAGRACIASDVSDVRTILDGNGRIIPAGDAEALANAMMEVRDLGPVGREALGRSARRNIIRRYSLDAVAADYQARYRALIGVQ